MAVTSMTMRDEFDLSVDPTTIKDDRGRATAFDGVPSWSVDDPALVDLRVAPDGMSAIVGSLDKLGAGTITVSGDGRAGPDEKLVLGVHSVVVQQGDVAVFELTAGEVRPRAEAPVEPPAA